MADHPHDDPSASPSSPPVPRAPKPAKPVHAELIWSDQLRFGATSGSSAIVVDGDNIAGPSPMRLVAFGLAGCMAIDIVLILQKGRHPLTGLRITLDGERSPDQPKQYVGINMHCIVTGAVPPDAVERAIALSRDKYCSVWHCLRQDIALTTTFEVISGS